MASEREKSGIYTAARDGNDGVRHAIPIERMETACGMRVERYDRVGAWYFSARHAIDTKVRPPVDCADCMTALRAECAAASPTGEKKDG